MSTTKASITERGYVYVIKSIHGYKIGKTKNPVRKNKIFGVRMSFDFDVALSVWCDDYHAKVKELHQTYSDKHLNGEWLDLNEDDIEFIGNYLK